jgi:putative intracellular protease/amidase
MSKKPAAHGTPAEVDADGLAIQKYHSMVLIVVPESDYGDEALRYARSCLYNVKVGTTSVSTQSQEMIKGRLQDEFLVDGPISEARMEPYSGVIFVGGEGAQALAGHPDALRLAREARAADKMIGAWGYAVGILARAGVLRGVRATGLPQMRAEIEKAGGKFTGRQVEVSGSIVTAADDAAGMRFGKALAEIVGI